MTTKTSDLSVTEEKKTFTNIYWDKKQNKIISRGIFPNPEKAKERVLDNEDLVFQDTAICYIQWSYSGPINKG